MNKLAIAMVVTGCWSDAQPAKPAPTGATTTTTSPSAPAYGGAAYGGAASVSDAAQPGPFASLTGTGDLSTGFDDTAADGGLVGRGSAGDGSGLARPSRAAAPLVSFGQFTVTTGLDQVIIRRYTKRAAAKIQYCYEKALLSTPGLAGTMVVQFRIEPTGKVGAATGSGLAGVDACVVDTIKQIEFPKPQGGTNVEVRAPFSFRPAAS
jgi:hypothetical protein